MTSAGKRKPRNSRASVISSALGGGGEASAAPTRSHLLQLNRFRVCAARVPGGCLAQEPVTLGVLPGAPPRDRAGGRRQPKGGIQADASRGLRDVARDAPGQ